MYERINGLKKCINVRKNIHKVQMQDLKSYIFGISELNETYMNERIKES